MNLPKYLENYKKEKSSSDVQVVQIDIQPQVKEVNLFK